MNEPNKSSGYRWLILSFVLPCLVVGSAAAGICIWDMWGQDLAEVVSASMQNFLFFGLLAGIAGIPVCYVIRQIRMRGLWG